MNSPFLKHALTYTEPSWVKKELGEFSDWEIRYRISTEERKRAMEQCWAVFLPYSFEDSVRVLVSTSFPSRLSECMTAGRPLLVYGPSYATLPSYFVANGLPVCVQSRTELKTAFRELEHVDSAGLIVKYEAALLRYHSKEAIRAMLGDNGARLTRQP
jgi:hypothetical protein